MTCAFAVRGAFRKLSGVESVDVSLNKGLASVKLKPGNALTVEQFWQTVRQNGFTPKETSVVIHGDVVQSNGKLQLRVSGANRTYDLRQDAKTPKAVEEVKRHIGGPITVEGTLVPGKDVTAPVPIQVRGAKP
ncbi:MAG TPA: heavy metal-associated domain-containing protein [Bryobacteraceae bacterium]|jgi:copper chaperone CopZ|nr:heavy metal-associated domain-containing protein [Bryobacteraceae bacterium]